ncbi:DNA-directed RNA polymerase III, subunit Rpc31 [Zychaea mexicana]|uniref:DNA-directed RNA polymerase III, subunit Rpc31 n=1 Tax=Zychaea mexicana TaxID=64656 RepID=UPI0022FDF273|nr:DNA-directed RNA polymerase III, subunit Rpc31 [Zychaea mexicana]KAI9493656.1 DNA-directed RNA polymerase III, subunit Rpc31 [Zychaea mexicana]
MSRGGRGGFRGGGGGPQSGAMQLVSFDLLKDLGSGSLFNVQTALFPEMDVPMARKPSTAEGSQWKHKDECIQLIQASPFYLVPPPPPPDIERYSDKYKKRKVKQSLRDIRTDMDFFPDELQSILDPSKRKKRKMANGTGDAFAQLQALMEMEGKDTGDGKDDDDEEGEKKEGENPEEEYGDDYEDEEDLVDDNDYAQNYFDNGEGDDVDDDDGDGGDFF